MDLLAHLVVNVVAHGGHPAEAKALALLLADGNTRCNLCGTVAGLPLGGVGVGFDGVAVLLGRAQRSILDVVGVELGLLSAGGALGHGGQAIPGHALVVSAGVVHGIQDTHLGAHLVKLFADSVPNQSGHIVPP